MPWNDHWPLLFVTVEKRVTEQQNSITSAAFGVAVPVRCSCALTPNTGVAVVVSSVYVREPSLMVRMFTVPSDAVAVLVFSLLFSFVVLVFEFSLLLLLLLALLLLFAFVFVFAFALFVLLLALLVLVVVFVLVASSAALTTTEPFIPEWPDPQNTVQENENVPTVSAVKLTEDVLPGLICALTPNAGNENPCVTSELVRLSVTVSPFVTVTLDGE